MINNLIIFDTSIFIDYFRYEKFEINLQNVNGLIRNSSVVLSKLLRGATKNNEINFIRTLEKNHPVLTPTQKNWIESGFILLKIKKDYGFLAKKIRDLHFDVLIALTARNYGAVVITSNKTDFELIQSYKEFKLNIWQ